MLSIEDFENQLIEVVVKWKELQRDNDNFDNEIWCLKNEIEKNCKRIVVLEDKSDILNL